MATTADDTTLKGCGGDFVAFVSRWIYVFMAGLFIVTVFAGFVPDSIGKMGDVAAGRRPPFPPILHVHAVLMGSWLLLLLTQATLMATGRRAIHKQLGLLAVVLAPAIVVAGFLLIPAMDGQLIDGIRHGPPEVAARLQEKLPRVMNIMLIQIRIGIVFAILVAIGLRARRFDTELHKRLMFLATAAALPAATDRIEWLPSSFPGSALTVELWPLLVIAPLFLWDVFRLRRIHRAYLVWFAVTLIPAVTMHLLWGTDWWRRTALALLGASDLA
ncbi:hypothetical protein IAG41_06105 [Sphingomonas sp. JC676]|uniref:hypothetical protein n=1 Tax=Sphingomonas sp. JC676 TaxID=2768065 RepID=UPI001657D0CE|nr:hypothetical protein [Sphingomonas sp. JC676]MBC9031959.1 hypothetical protein [Sphingomonas sp. JC676]